MTEGNYPGQQPQTPGYGEGNQGYGPTAGQPAGAPGAPAGYGAPGDPYGAPGDPYGTPARREDTIGVVGMVIAAIGALLVVLAFTVFKWFRNGTADNPFGSKNDKSKFSDIHDALDKVSAQINGAGQGLSKDVSFGVSKLYFGWLGWVLLGVAVVVAVLALLPTAAAPALRLVGLIVGIAAAAITVWALDLISVSGTLASLVKSRGDSVPGFTDYIKHSGLGAWAAIAGFLLIGIGAVIGPQRR